MELLEIDWYYKPPIDFEHKQWTLFAYLRDVDDSFNHHVFSPYLLHSEKLVEEMRVSFRNINSFNQTLSPKKLVFNWEGLFLMKDPPKMKEIETIMEVLDFSIPLLSQRVDLGKKLHRKFPGLLY